MLVRSLRNRVYFVVGVFLAASFLLGTAHAAAIHDRARETISAIRKVVPLVTTLHPQTGAPTPVCSAVMLSPERAITANHCTKYDTLSLRINGVDYPVLERAANPERDLAILVVPNAPCPCATIRGRRVEQDEVAYLVGHPSGGPQTVSAGRVQGYVTTTREQVVLSADGAPGKSGGGMFDERGHMFAVATQSGWSGHITFGEDITPTPAFVSKMSADGGRVGVYDNAKVYLDNKQCASPDSQGLNAGRIVFNNGRVLGMCWIETPDAVWIIDDDGGIAAEDPSRYVFQKGSQ